MPSLDKIYPQSKRKAINALAFSARYLAEANVHKEQGSPNKAEKLFAKSQFWLDRYNRIVGNS